MLGPRLNRKPFEQHIGVGSVFRDPPTVGAIATSLFRELCQYLQERATVVGPHTVRYQDPAGSAVMFDRRGCERLGPMIGWDAVGLALRQLETMADQPSRDKPASTRQQGERHAYQ